MFYDRKKMLNLGLIILATAVAAGPAIAVAQRKSPGGLTGEARLHPGSSANQRASRNMRHARDYSRDIYQYSQTPRSIQPSVAKSEAEELGRNIASAQKELTVVREEVGSNPAAAAPLKSIDQHLAAAEKQHAMLFEECCKESVDGLTCMKHCNQILLELDKAQAEHDALMRSMDIKEKAAE
ncbi:hypothetical protein [Botrimarina mediterranea]|uniref:hypothetical protein n=1 Tax=Botrimarina mediterranea TaxID=2528022 RepID=UPI00118AFCCC|nr:hypothetical protein K2D_19820 [Planctomycetes bacterium K2D]